MESLGWHLWAPRNQQHALLPVLAGGEAGPAGRVGSGQCGGSGVQRGVASPEEQEAVWPRP